MASYKEEITAANARLAEDDRTVFVGYGLQHGRAMGTIPAHAQIVETPVAENLMVGVAIGLALQRKLPVVFIERCDFLLNALDAIVNHLDKIHRLSSGDFQPAVILRVMVGNREKPLFTGPVHTQDFCQALAHMVDFPVRPIRKPEEVAGSYQLARIHQERRDTSTALFEYKDLM